MPTHQTVKTPPEVAKAIERWAAMHPTRPYGCLKSAESYYAKMSEILRLGPTDNNGNRIGTCPLCNEPGALMVSVKEEGGFWSCGNCTPQRLPYYLIEAYRRKIPGGQAFNECVRVGGAS
jgi:hypothetical protein